MTKQAIERIIKTAPDFLNKEKLRKVLEEQVKIAEFWAKASKPASKDLSI